jgi:hypothetical protein
MLLAVGVPSVPTKVAHRARMATMRTIQTRLLRIHF